MPIKILSIQDVPAYGADGRLVRHRIVTYSVDDMGPFGLDGPATELTNEVIRQKIRAEAAQIRRLKELEV